ncbi:rhamnose-binding lectin [Aethina tumida]|uniref:rhamnose-binding lectin n=1 Tax=Aethina tumida TaxID=116153 RepID=UPI002147A286|nr:rhamnose-binding lectin [Aethina tumida]
MVVFLVFSLFSVFLNAEAHIVCENTDILLYCNGGSIIITNATYGRLNAETCPGSSVSNTSCVATNSLSIVENVCNDRHSCTVSATNAQFNGDPCQGTSKYLSIEWICTASTSSGVSTETTARPVTSQSSSTTQAATTNYPSGAISTRTCHGDKLKIKCGSKNIHVLDVFYGRQDLETCPHKKSSKGFELCDGSAEARNRVLKKCEGDDHCILFANNLDLGKKCDHDDVYGYLNLVYICV